MVAIKKSAYFLLLTENDIGKYKLLKLKRNFTYDFDSILFNIQIDLCYIYNILHLLTSDELDLLSFICLYNKEQDLNFTDLSIKFRNLYLFCGEDMKKFSDKIIFLKNKINDMINLSSHPKAIDILLDKINELSNSLNLNIKPLVYPGGRKKQGDKNLLDSATRETEEEIKLKKMEISVLKTKPLFKETYLSSDNTKYAAMFFLAKIKYSSVKDIASGKYGRIENIFDEIVLVDLDELDDNNLFESIIKNIKINRLETDKAKVYIGSILNSQEFRESDIYKNYNSGKYIRDYNKSFIEYISSDKYE